jgi:hypothetical protein
LQRHLAALHQLQQARLRDVQVIGHIEFHHGLVDEVPGVELQKQVKGLAGAARPATLSVHQVPLLESIQPTCLVRGAQGQHAGLPLTGYPPQQVKKVGAIDDFERKFGLRFLVKGACGSSAAAE